jgi:predicted transposase YdaD
MQKYYAALKSVLTRGSSGFLSGVIGVDMATFLNVDLPDARSRRPDLLGEARDGTLFHVELQSTNDPRMAFRMLDYLVAIEREYGRIPRQLVLYVGRAPMKMENRIVAGGLSFEFRMVDIRSFDGEQLLESDSLDDNIVSILARQPDARRAVRRILEKIAASNPVRRAEALQELTILAGLRSLGEFVEEESRQMPILEDIMDHDLLGPLLRQGMAAGEIQGMEKGLETGIAKGRVEGERAFFQKLATRRFGTLPNWATERISQLGIGELEDLGVRLLDARSLEELFGTH